MEAITLIGTIFGLGFVSGLNLYATVLTVGMIVRLNLIALPESMQDLAVLGHPTVMIVAGVLFAIEFVADKIPWVDSSWDSVHTLIRPVGAAVMGGYALTGADPATETALALACGGVALTSHTAKAGTRVMANASPEPFSNTFLSLFEDVIVVVGVGLTFLLPVLMLAMVVLFIMVFIWLSPKLYRVLKGGAGKVRGVLGGRGDAKKELDMNAEKNLTARVTRHIKATPERVFDAWLDPELLGQWMFGPNVREEEILHLKVNPKVGGSFSFLVRRGDMEFDHIGEYLEIDRPLWLVFTWGVRQDEGTEFSRVEVEVVPVEGGSELKISQEMPPKWADFVEQAQGAWQRMTDAMARVLE